MLVPSPPPHRAGRSCGRPQYPCCYAPVPLLPCPSARTPPTGFPSWGLAFGAQGDSLMLFNADGADGYPGHPGPTCRNGSREETTFGAIHSITCSRQPVQARAPSPSSLLVHAETDVTPQPPARAALPEGSPPAPCSLGPAGTQPLSPAGKVTCRSGQSRS